MSLLACAALATAARGASPVEFVAPTHDFGAIGESAGKVSHTFEFVNSAQKPIVVQRVLANCGCIVADYSRRPVAPGGRGVVRVTFDPAGRPGAFMREVVVQFDGVKTRVSLTGTVLADRYGDYPVEIAGGVRAQRAAVDFGVVGQGGSKAVCVPLINTSERTATLRLSGTGGGGAFRVVHPRRLAPGARGCLSAVCDLRGKEAWGRLFARVRIYVDGVEGGESLALMAAAVDDFPAPGGDAPEASFDRTTIDFGGVAPGETRKATVRLANVGDAPLAIRAVKMPANATCKLREGTTIPPGGSVRFTVGMSFSSGEVSGRQSALVAIVTNDPATPITEMELRGEISKK